MCQLFRHKFRWGVVSLLFPLADRLRAATCEVTIADEKRGCHCSSLCSEHVDEICFEARSLLRREFARGDGSYMTKPGRTSKVTAIPTRFAHTQSVGSGDARPVSARQRRREEWSVRRYLFVRSWPS